LLQMVPCMELFHPFKQLLEDIFSAQIFFKPFIAPFIHHFHPGDDVRINPILKNIDTWFTVMRLSWRKRRLAFYALLPQIQGSQKNHFLNLMALMEYFIPLVIISFL
jgi:hypothetical protein